MDSNNILTIFISILSSSVVTLFLSTYIFAQIVLYPEEAKYAVGVQRYDIQQLSAEQSIKNAINDLKMALPKLVLITENKEERKQIVPY